MQQVTFAQIETDRSGAEYLTKVRQMFQDAISNRAGASAPSDVLASELWVDTSTDPWAVKMYDGGAHRTILTISPTTGLVTVPVASGGTGANTAAGARTALGALGNVVEDTTPQLGGALDTNNKAVNFSEGANVASASAPNIWADDGNTVHITGTTGISDFADAPRAGASRWLVFDDAVLVTHGAGITVQGGADYTTEAGDMAFVYADAVDAFRMSIFKVDGHAVAETPQSEFTSGVKMVFAQASPPTGWTQDAAYTDQVLRFVSGAGDGTGGTASIAGGSGTGSTGSPSGVNTNLQSGASASASNTAHTHGVTVTYNIKYRDVIAATKD